MRVLTKVRALGATMYRRRQLPPLNALRAFEAASRHQNFVLAADELNVSAGAISHQVKQLETWVGRPLFERLPHGIFITDAGRELGVELRSLLDRVATISHRVKEQTASGRVGVVSQFSLSAKWIAPRLAELRRIHPRLDVRLAAQSQDSDPRNYDGDIFIFFSHGPIAGFIQHPLVEMRYDVVVAPSLLEEAPKPLRPADLLQLPLLESTLRSPDWCVDWATWFHAARVAGAEPVCHLQFSMHHLAMEAAIAGGGFALLPDALVERDVADGRLVRPFDVQLPVHRYYHLIVAEEKLQRPEVRQVMDWLLFEEPRRIAPRQRATAPSY